MENNSRDALLKLVSTVLEHAEFNEESSNDICDEFTDLFELCERFDNDSQQTDDRLFDEINHFLEETFTCASLDCAFSFTDKQAWHDILTKNWPLNDHLTALAILIYFASSSFINKQALSYQGNIKDILLDRIEQCDEHPAEQIKIIKAYEELYSLLLSVNCRPREVVNIYDSVPTQSKHRILKHLVNQVSDPLVQNFLHFHNTSYSANISREAEYDCVSLQLHIVFNDVTSNRFISFGDNLFFEITEGKFSISNQSSLINTVNDFAFESDILYLLVFQISGNMLTIYVDGKFINNIEIPANQSIIPLIKNFTIGSPICSFKIYRLYVWDVVLSSETIVLLNRLGPLHQNSYMIQYDFKGIYTIANRGVFTEVFLDSEVSAYPSYDAFLENFQTWDVKHIVYELDIPHLISDFGNNNFLCKFPAENETDDIQYGKCHYFQNSNISSILHSIDFIQFSMNGIETSENLDEVYEYTEELVVSLRDPILLNWFIYTKGFALLSHVLHQCVLKHKQGLTIQFMDLFLSNFCLNYETIKNLMIKNNLAYEYLILKFDLWHYPKKESSLSPTSETELLRFVCFHINLLLTSSKYSPYNLPIFIKNKMILKLFYFFYQNTTLNLTLVEDDIINTISPLVLMNVTSQNIEMFLNFSFLGILNGNSSNTILCLGTLDRIFSQSLQDRNIDKLRLLNQCIHARTTLFLISKLVVMNADPTIPLKILFRTFLSNSTLFVNFSKGNGMPILIHALALSEPKYYKSIIHKLFLFSVGLQDSSLNDPAVYAFETSSPSSVHVVFAEPLIISMVILDNVIQRCVKEKIRINDFIVDYCSVLRNHDILSIEHPFKANTVNPLTTRLLQSILELFVTLTVNNDTGLFTKSIDAILELYVEASFNSLTSMDGNIFEDFLTDLLFPIRGSVDDVDKLPSQSYLDLSFFKSILPILLKRILKEDLTQKPRNIVTKNIVHLFNVFVNYFMSIKVTSEFLLDTFEVLARFLSHNHKTSIFLFHKTSTGQEIAHLFDRYTYLMLYLQFTKQTKWKPSDVQRMCNILTDNEIVSLAGSHFNLDVNVTAMITVYFILQLNENPSITIVSEVLRSILRASEKSLPSIVRIITTTHRNQLLPIFTAYMRNDNDESLALILSIDAMILNTSSLTKFSNICRSSAGILSSQLKIDATQLGDKIKDAKEKTQLETIIKVEPLFASFMEKNVELHSGFVYSGNKLVNECKSDIEEDINFYRNIIRRSKLNFLHVHNIQDSLPQETFWRLDFAEDVNRAHKRLLPCYRTDDYDEDLASGTIADEGCSAEITVSSIEDSIIQSNSPGNHARMDMDSFFQKNENRKILRLLKDGDTISHIWNSSLIIGLDLKEGILILGKRYLYFVHNYYFSEKEGNVVNITTVPESLRDVNIGLVIGDSIKQQLPSRNFTEVNSWHLNQLTFVMKRPFLLRDVAIEIMFDNNTTMFFSFKKRSIRENIYHLLTKLSNRFTLDPLYAIVLEELNERNNIVGTKNGISKTSITSKFVNLMTSNIKSKHVYEVTELWKSGMISNFYYLMVVNTLAGRSFNDLTQYPVFPWVIADYTSETLDLDNEETFRDLSKPMGAQSEKRRQMFVDRYEALKSVEDETSPAFHYGTHYSSAMIVSSYLIRLKPFTESFLLLQDGHFGHADRLFSSIERAWLSAAVENTTDVRELIPEFYFLPEFLLNMNGYDFGIDQNGQRVNDVKLPPWAHGDPKVFVAKNREALESPYVSEHLHEWIDLIFGYKQRGEMAELSVNVFNRMSYPGAINLDTIDDENERRALAGIIHNFGQTPLQIFQEPHVKRERVHSLKIDLTSLVNIKREAKNDAEFTLVHHVLPKMNSFSIMSHISRPSTPTRDYVSPTIRAELCGSESIIVNGVTFNSIHLSRISICVSWKNNILVTGDVNGLIKIWEVSSINSEIQLIHKATLHGHLHEIKEISTLPEYYTLVTLDTHGNVFTWDMISYELIRKAHTSVKMMSVSKMHGTMIFLLESNELCLCNMNTLDYTSLALPVTSNVTAIQFLTIESGDSCAPHTYLNEFDVFFVGYASGQIDIHQLKLGTTNGWEVEKLSTLECALSESPVVGIDASARIQYSEPSGEDKLSSIIISDVKVTARTGDDQCHTFS